MEPTPIAAEKPEMPSDEVWMRAASDLDDAIERVASLAMQVRGVVIAASNEDTRGVTLASIGSLAVHTNWMQRHSLSDLSGELAPLRNLIDPLYSVQQGIADEHRLSDFQLANLRARDPLAA